MKSDKLFGFATFAAIFLWVLSALISLAMTVALCVIVYHFVMKYW